MEPITIFLTALVVMISVAFTLTLLKMKKRIEVLEAHIDIQTNHSQVMNEVFQKSINIIKDALIDFDSRINTNKMVIMASVDGNRINAETRLTNLEAAEKNNNLILQQEIRTTRTMVDRINSDLELLMKASEEMKEEFGKVILVKNMIEARLKSLSSFGVKLLTSHRK